MPRLARSPVDDASRGGLQTLNSGHKNGHSGIGFSRATPTEAIPSDFGFAQERHLASSKGFNLQEIFAALAEADARYVVVGGLAVILHGHLRATRDLDLVIGLEPNNCASALAALAKVGLQPRLPVTMQDFADPEKRRDWAEQRNMQVFQLWQPGNPLRSVDVFVREPMDFDELWNGSSIKDLDGVPIRVAGIRHLIAMKQVAARPRDLDDINALRQIAKETGQPVD